MEIQEILRKLTPTFGKVLHETILSLLPTECEVKTSPLGNIMVRFPGESQETILLDAHMDIVHFTVTSITREGFLKVAPCGGVDCRVLSGSEVTVWGTTPLYGLFTIMPPHLTKASNSSAVAVEEHAIDIGLSFDKANELVKPGDLVTFGHTFTQLSNKRISSHGLDNLAGVAAFIALSRKLMQADLKNTVVLQFSNFEETGHRFAGGVTGAFSVTPQEAVVIDASFGKTPSLQYATPGEIGEGVMIGVSPMLSKEISLSLEKIAKDHNIPYTKEILGGTSSTNADGIVTAGGGIPTGLLSYPLLNMHSSVETVSEKDLDSLVSLLELYCQKGGSFNGK